MPSKRWINKSTATTYQLVHRAQADPLTHDTTAPSRLFQEVAAPQIRKIRTRRDLETELFGHDGEDGSRNPGDGELAAVGLRKNEGEAAAWGVYYDDSEYDYMQHLRELDGDGTFVDAENESKSKSKGKAKDGLVEALRAATLDDVAESTPPHKDDTKLHDSDYLPTELSLTSLSYQAQQDVPDVLGGFQPDMDPRLREVLEALEDEAYVDEEGGEDGVWSELVGGKEELDLAEWTATSWDSHDGPDHEDEGWESDETERPLTEYRDAGIDVEQESIDESESSTSSTFPSTNTNEDDPAINDLHHDTTDPSHNSAIPPSNNWLDEYGKYKQATARVSRAGPLAPSSALLSGMSSLANGRHKKRKGARTSDSTYSMSSASIARSEGLELLDRRFERIEVLYAEDEDGDEVGHEDGDEDASVVSGFSGFSGSSRISGTSSKVPELRRRTDFDEVMDAFLAETGGREEERGGKRRRGKRGGGGQSGLEQLDEIRRELGPPVLKVVGGS